MTRGRGWLLTNALVVKGAQTAVLLVLAALLAPQALGVVALGSLVANVAVVLAGVGSATALVGWAGEAERAARTAVTIAAVSGTVVAGVAWVLAPWLADLLGTSPDAVGVVRGLVLPVPLLAVAAVSHELLRRRRAFLRRVVPDTTASVVGAVVAVALLADGRGVTAFVVGQVVQGVVTLALTWCVHPVVRPGWDTGDARRLLGFGVPLAGANLVQLVQLNLDYVVVSVVLGGVALGHYSLAFRLAFLPHLLVVVVVAGAAFPHLCALAPSRRGPAAVAVTTTALTLLTPLCVGLAVLSGHLTLLGEQWAPAVPVVAVLAGYAWALGPAHVVASSLTAAGRPSLTLALRVGHLLGLAAVLVVVADRGIVAVAGAQVAVAVVVATAALVLARRVLPGFSLRALARDLAPTAGAALLMALVLVVVTSLLEGVADGPVAGVLVLVTAGLAGLAAYAGGHRALTVRGGGAPRWDGSRDTGREAGWETGREAGSGAGAGENLPTHPDGAYTSGRSRDRWSGRRGAP